MAPPPTFKRIAPEVIENARKQEHSSFFEHEGLTEFLNLEWGIEVDEALVLEFIDSYHAKNRTAAMSSGEIALHDELMQEVFRLPAGRYKLPKRRKIKKVISPYCPDSSGFKGTPRGALVPDVGFLLAMCNDEVWKDRFSFLQLVFSIKTTKREIIPYFFVEFLQTHGEGRKRDWLEAFRWFFEAEIARIREEKTSTVIGTHITLLLAHVQKKKELEERPKQKRARRERSEPKKARRESQDVVDRLTDHKVDGEKNAVERVEALKDEVEKEQTPSPAMNFSNVEEQILQHFDMGRQGISELRNVVTGLRNEVDLWARGHGTALTELRNENQSLRNEAEMWKTVYGNQITALMNENCLLNTEVEKWKNEAEIWKIECSTVEQGRRDLEAKVTTFWATTKLGTTDDTFKVTRPHPLEFSTPAVSERPRERKP